MGIIDLDGLEVRLANRIVLNGLHGRAAGAGHRPARPQRRGKIHADQYAARVSSPLERERPASLGSTTHKDRAQIRGGIGYMPENDSFIGNMSGVRFVRYMAELAGLPSGVALERAHEAFSMSGWARCATAK